VTEPVDQAFGSAGSDITKVRIQQHLGDAGGAPEITAMVSVFLKGNEIGTGFIG
jgi:hypothetical protein